MKAPRVFSVWGLLPLMLAWDVWSWLEDTWHVSAPDARRRDGTAAASDELVHPIESAGRARRTVVLEAHADPGRDVVAELDARPDLSCPAHRRPCAAGRDADDVQRN